MAHPPTHRPTCEGLPPPALQPCLPCRCRRLNKRWGSSLRWYVPLGVGKWLRGKGVPRECISEADWWQVGAGGAGWAGVWGVSSARQEHQQSLLVANLECSRGLWVVRAVGHVCTPNL